MQNDIKKEGFNFAFNPSACENCEGNCCIGESGYVWVTPQERQEIAKHLGLDEASFIQKHLRKVQYRYSLKERQVGESFECEFFDITKRQCSIYDVRPSQCRTFPFWDYFKTRIKEVEEECPGIIRYS